MRADLSTAPAREKTVRSLKAAPSWSFIQGQSLHWWEECLLKIWGAWRLYVSESRRAGIESIEFSLGRRERGWGDSGCASLRKSWDFAHSNLSNRPCESVRSPGDGRHVRALWEQRGGLGLPAWGPAVFRGGSRTSPHWLPLLSVFIAPGVVPCCRQLLHHFNAFSRLSAHW